MPLASRTTIGNRHRPHRTSHGPRVLQLAGISDKGLTVEKVLCEPLEHNVFTRRLYTLQGQQAFDEIRKKYRADREFKQTVDRYIGEFERLLDEVARDDRGHVVARTYLTSETGKVYTMLAHAAGRFD